MRDRMLVNLLTTSAWALHEPTLRSLAAMVARHAAGVKLSSGEIDRIKGKRASSKPKAQRDGAAGGSIVYTDGDIAVIEINGVIEPHAGGIEDISQPPGTSPDQISDALAWAAESPDISAILLAFNSPGGSVERIAELSDTIFELAAAKPIISHVDELCASAAYWLAAQTSGIYGGPTAIAGSIGIYSVIADTSRLYEEDFKTTIHLVRYGEHKGDGVPGTEVTEAQLEESQRLIDATGDVFVAHVARGLKISKASARKLADGRIHVGRDAVDVGLMDAVQSFSTTLAQMKRDYPTNRPASDRAKPGQPLTMYADAYTSNMKDESEMNASRKELAAKFAEQLQRITADDPKRSRAVSDLIKRDPDGHRAWLAENQATSHQAELVESTYSDKD